jgi:hypothetical protein
VRLIRALVRFERILPTALIGLYVLGFLVVLGNLAQYGVSSLDVFKLQYLVTGFWCISPLLITAALGSTNFAQVERLQSPLRGTLLRVAQAFAFPFVGYLLLLSASYLGLGTEAELLDALTAKWTLFLKLAALLVAGVLAIGYAHQFWIWSSQKTEHQELFRNISLFLSVVSALIVLVYIGFFSVRIYPLIPHNLGGGRPLWVSFVLAKTDEPTKTFLTLQGDGPQTIKYYLLLERENSLIVMAPYERARAIEFDRKAISAMIVLKEDKCAR